MGEMRVEAREVDGDLMYLTCPSCGRDIYDPFSRFSGPVPFRHAGRGKGQPVCRLIITPDPLTETADVTEVPAEESMDDYLRERLDATLLDQVRASFARVMDAVDGAA